MVNIAIVGTAGSAKNAPFHDPAWEIWSMTENHKIPGVRVDRWFEMHRFSILRKYCGAKKDYFDFLAIFGDKLTTMQSEPETPKARVLKRDELINTFEPYFTSSIAWMLGEALLENPEKLGLWGVHCSGNNEYANQRAAIEGYLRFAQGRGIPTFVHPDSSLFKAPLYCDEDHMRLQTGIKRANKRKERARDDANYFSGYEEALDFFRGGIGE